MIFRELTERFNDMSAELKHQFDQLYREQQALQQAKIKALQSQINPHFLNNTLEVINWEARMADDDKELMLSVARALALYAHFLNFNENSADINERHRTRITIVSRDKDILSKMQQEEYLYNLPLYCCLYLQNGSVKNLTSYIDIEIEITNECSVTKDKFEDIITADQVNAFCDSKDSQSLYFIDTRRAVWSERIYSLGASIDNLPYEDIHDPERYALALDIFQYSEMRKKVTSLMSENQSVNKVKEHLSSLFCSDCFDSRYNAIQKYYGGKKARFVDNWKLLNDALCMSEHARWVTEKLIMGYRPLNEQERLFEESLFDKEKDQYRKRLKSNTQDPSHIDICSLADLRRIDPDSLKYDSFLMLSIPAIIANE